MNVNSSMEIACRHSQSGLQVAAMPLERLNHLDLLLTPAQFSDSVLYGHGVAQNARTADDSYRERSRWDHLFEPTGRWVFLLRPHRSRQRK